MFRITYAPRHHRRHRKTTWLMRFQCWANLYFVLRVT